MHNKYFIKARKFAYIFLNKDYRFLIFLISLSALSLSIIAGIIIYNNYTRSVSNKLISSSSSIDNTLVSTFRQIEHFMNYVSRGIVHKPDDLKFINRMLGNIPNDRYKTISKMFSWTFFDWIDSNNFQVINQKEGILPTPYDMSNREYIIKSRQLPWTLQFSKPSIGVPSGDMVIPIGMGVTDENKKFLGILSGGLEIITLTAALQEKITSSESFIIFNEQLAPILYSSDICLAEIEEKLTLSGILSVLDEMPGYLSFNHPLRSQFFYSIHKKIPGYPYSILTGTSLTIFLKGYLTLVLPYIILIIGMSIFALVIVHITGEKTSNITYASDKAEQEFSNLINEQLQLQIDIIVQNSTLLLRFLKGEVEVGINKTRQIEMVSLLNEAAIKLHGFTVSQNFATRININEIVKESITMKYKKAMQKGIHIRSYFQDDIPLLYIDLISIKQIITGLLALAIDTTPQSGRVEITTLFEANDYTQQISIIIKDTGLAIDENDMQRISAIFRKTKNKIHKMDLELSHIIELVEANRGCCHVDSKLGDGRTVIISFPVSAFNEKVIEVEEPIANDNKIRGKKQ